MSRPGWRSVGLGWPASAAGLVVAAAFRPGHATAVPGGPVGDLLEDDHTERPSPPRRPDPNRLGHRAESGGRQHNTEHGERGTASKRIIAGYGFWIFLLSDIIMFAAFFAAYAVLSGETAGGPAGKDLFDLKITAIETGCLLLSSFACGVASIGAQTRRGAWFYGGMATTLVLGTVFLGLEVREFAGLVARDAGPGRSAFLSAFFALVGCHGLPRAARRRGPAVAYDDGGAGLGQGLPPRHPAADALFQPVLARAGHHLGRGVHDRLPDGVRRMSGTNLSGDRHGSDTAPGDARGGDDDEGGVSLQGYLIGFGLAVLLTGMSFVVAGTSLVWAPSIPVALFVLAIAQMGVHLVFFLHITTGPDGINNVMALAFGVLIVLLLIGGSLWIMAHLNHNMLPMDRIMQMQR